MADDCCIGTDILDEYKIWFQCIVGGTLAIPVITPSGTRNNKARILHITGYRNFCRSFWHVFTGTTKTDSHTRSLGFRPPDHHTTTTNNKHHIPNSTGQTQIPIGNTQRCATSAISFCAGNECVACTGGKIE